jgi:hypothetical protein
MADGQNQQSRLPLPTWLAPLRFVGRVVLSIILILWTLVEALLFPLLKPLLNLLGQLRLFEAIGAGIGKLPPYVALLVFAVPFIIIEPIKAFALYWFGVGHFIQGGVLYVLAHIASIVIVERIYHAAREPLLRIGWFARLMKWLVEVRRIGVEWAKATVVWQSASRLALSVRAAFSG